VHARREKGGDLPFHNPLLQRRQEGFRLGQGQPDLFNLLARLLQDDHVSDGLFMIIIVIDHQVDFDLHGALLRLNDGKEKDIL
jgi:hypothetical protein